VAAFLKHSFAFATAGFFVELKQNSSLVSCRRKAFKFYLGCQSNEIILRAHFHKILQMTTAVLEISIP